MEILTTMATTMVANDNSPQTTLENNTHSKQQCDQSGKYTQEKSFQNACGFKLCFIN
jgi:hypothetical protein